ncbi:AAC(3) family N-acetyltransferase [Sulfuricystis multivorans]|uniref:AAC(3) family N-acetyltransferase n=1 Tax=Sulfuricystis multivorans TaxID=2211108 RepID=UPI000F842911|nr:AAC(3) family N-acetyltransferase [Sulfuricystis multivorans]
MQIEVHHVTSAFAACGIKPGHCLMLHADAFPAAQLPGDDLAQRMDKLLDGVLAALGSDGTLVMPTFSYSATKGEVFCPARTPSEVGLLSEHFRQRRGVQRSKHPIFSVAASGSLAERFAKTIVEDCFGADTAFDLLMRHDAWIASLGCSMDRMTFVHYVEQAHGVTYRYFKKFPFAIEMDGAVEQGWVRYYVRDLERRSGVALDRLKSRLMSAGVLKVAEIGRAQLLCVRARDFFTHASECLDQQENALIEEGVGEET